ncbi:hypothetical protein CD798_04610 [Bacillaceae bacterium SAOS 7]|nr:hypothetical protein CD798_04610 [Bacillaceae bacterium SAOS 7]
MTYPRFVVTDLETTGHAAKSGDRMIQASFVIIENNQIIDQYTTFINPERSIPVFIEELTGIDDEMDSTHTNRFREAGNAADFTPEISN